MTKPIGRLAIALLLLAAVLTAQTSIVYGKITLNNNQPATGVAVSIAGRTVLTDSGGRFRIDGVPYGTTSMVLTRQGAPVAKYEVTINQPQQQINKKCP